VEIRQCFEFRGSETLKDTFKEVRKKPDKCPQWLDEAIWKELWVYWNSDAFKKKSNVAKMNRTSTMVLVLLFILVVPSRLMCTRRKW